MSAVFNPAALPELPGVYTTYTPEESAALPPSPGSIIALPITHTWGPANVALLIESFSEFEELFGTDDSPGRRAVYDAFRGEGLEGQGGASGVYVNRFAASAAAKATVTLKNPAAASAVTIKGRYLGTRGNRLKVLVTPIASGKQSIIVLDGTAELESFSLTIAGSGALAGLVAEIGAISPYIEGTLVLEGTTGLAAGTFTLTGGSDGTTMTGEDWLAVANTFNDVDFAYFAPFDLPWETGEPSETTVLSLQAWCDGQNEHGHRFTMIVGGALDEDPGDAVIRSQAISDPNVINVGGPGVNDDLFGALSTSQLVPRIAGIRAQRGENQAAHFARLAGTLPRTKADGSGVTLAELESMVRFGVIALQRDRYKAAPTRIVKDVNTWAPLARTPAEAAKPREIYGNPKFVQSMQQFANDADADLAVAMIGKATVNPSSRAAAAARVLRLAAVREKTGAFQPGVEVIPVPTSDSADYIRLQIRIAFGRALAQLFLDAKVR